MSSMRMPITAFIWIAICISLAVSGEADEPVAQESFVQSHIGSLDSQRIGHQSMLMTLQDSVKPMWNGSKLVPGSLIHGAHINTNVGANMTVSLTLVNGAEFLPGSTQSQWMPHRATSISDSLSSGTKLRQGGKWLSTAMVTDGFQPLPVRFYRHGSLTRFRLEHRSKAFNLQFERAEADKDLLTASGAWINALNTVAPLPRSVNALKGCEFTSLSLGSRFGALNLSGNWRSISGGGEVERYSVGLHGSGIKLHIGETRIEQGARINPQAAAEEIAALTSEFNALGKEFAMLGAPVKLASLQPFPNLRESERLLAWEPSKDVKLRHESVRISNGSGELLQTATTLNLAGIRLTATRRTDSVDANLTQQALKLVGKEALASLIGHKQTVTQLLWAPSNAFQISHTVTEVEALQGAKSNVSYCRTRMTEVSLRPDKDTSASFAFGQAETQSKDGSTSQVELTQWNFNRQIELGEHNLVLSHSGRRMEPRGSEAYLLSRTSLSLATNPKSPTRLQLSIIRTEEHPDRGNDGTHTKVSLQSLLSSSASLAANWERKPTPKGTFELSECTLKLAQFELRYRAVEEPLPQGVERKVNQLQLQHPLTEDLNVVVNLSSVEQGDHKVRENSLAMMSVNPESNETLIKVSSVNKQNGDTSEQMESLTLVQPITKEMHIGTEIARTSDDQGNQGEQQRIYITAVPKSDSLPQVHVGYERMRQPLGKTIQTPLARVSIGGKKSLRLTAGYALNQTQQLGRLPMRELVLQLPIGKAKLEIYRFSNMPQNWTTRWTKESWFLRNPMSPFPTLPSGQKLNQLSLTDWVMVAVNIPLAKDWMLEISANRLRPYSNADPLERKEASVLLNGKTGRNGKLQFSIRHICERRKQPAGDMKGLIYTISHSWRLSDYRHLSLSAHYNTNERLPYPGVQEGTYSLMLSLSQVW